MAVDCTTMELMQVLRRFFSIPGFPAIILSDNGSQMSGAAKELRDMVTNLKGDQLRESALREAFSGYLLLLPPHTRMDARRLLLRAAKDP